MWTALLFPRAIGVVFLDQSLTSPKTGSLIFGIFLRPHYHFVSEMFMNISRNFRQHNSEHNPSLICPSVYLIKCFILFNFVYRRQGFILIKHFSVQSPLICLIVVGFAEIACYLIYTSVLGNFGLLQSRTELARQNRKHIPRGHASPVGNP